MSNRLEGKIAIITGGCSGIGLATVERFIREGAHCVIADIQDERGEALVKRFAGRATYRHCDITQETDIAAAVAGTLSEFGGLDIFFNNAGGGATPAPITELLAEDWDRAMQFLLRGPMLGIKHAARAMKQRGGGSIVNTASIAGLEGGWGGHAYAVAKAGLIHLSRVVAAELAAHHIRVNSIAPGVIVTPIYGVAAGLSRDAAAQRMEPFAQAAKDMQPVRRAGEAEDIAAAALYLCSDDASFITGTNLLVDGGLLAGQRSAWDSAIQLPMRTALAHVASERMDESRS